MNFEIIKDLAKVAVLMALYNIINMGFIVMMYTILSMPNVGILDVIAFVIFAVLFIFQNSMLSNFIYKRIDNIQ